MAGALWDIVRTALTEHRPVYFTAAEHGDLVNDSHGDLALARVPGATLVHEGLVSRVVPIDQRPTAVQSLATALRLEQCTRYETAPSVMFQYEPDGDYTNKAYSQDLIVTGRLLEDKHQFIPAYDRISRAYDMDPDRATTADAFAYASVLVGRMGDAIDAWQVAERLDPTNASYKKNLQTALSQSMQSENPRG